MKVYPILVSVFMVSSVWFASLRAEASSGTVEFTAAILRFKGAVPKLLLNKEGEAGTLVIDESIDELIKATKSLPGGELITNMKLQAALGKDVSSMIGQHLVKNEIGWAPVDKAPESANDDGAFFIGNDLKVKVTEENDSIYRIDVDFNHHELEGFVEHDDGSTFPVVRTLSSKSELSMRPDITYVIGYSSSVSTTEPQTSEAEDVSTFFVCSVKPD